MSRLDKWLFHARFYRTRPMAQAATMAGRIRLNGVRVEKPGHALKPGDILTLGLGGNQGSQVIAVRVLALAERRGPAVEAQTLYEVIVDTSCEPFAGTAASIPLPPGPQRRKHSAA